MTLSINIYDSKYTIEDNNKIIKKFNTKEEVKIYLSIIGKNFKRIYRDWKYDYNEKFKRSAFIILD